jgi:predicted kinase
LRPDRDGKIDRGRVGFQSDGLSGLQFRSGPKKLAGMAPTSRRTDKFQQGIYAEQFTEQTYVSLLEAAEQCLARGNGVIIDATFAAPRYRNQFLDLAGRFNVPVLFIECR